MTLVSCGGASESPGKCYSPIPAVCASLGVGRSFPDPVPTDVNPAGLYKGLTSSGRSFASLVLDDGSYYSIYSQVNNPSIVAGGERGTVKTSGTSFSITDAVDFNFEGLGTNIASITGTVDEKKSIQGSINYPTTSQNITFSANYSPDYELTPSISNIVGRYVGASESVGSSNSVSSSDAVMFDINANGDITGSGNSGCTFSGTIKPRTSGNAYNVTITFGASPCQYPGATITGASYFDRTSNIVYAVASTPTGSANFITTATKQ
jgi:hypothetical protein